VRRPRASSTAIARFAAGRRERYGLEPQEEFFVPFWWRLSDDIDTSPWWGDPSILGWIVTADDRLEPVSRQQGTPPGVHVLTAQPRSR
jgi:hypothetical protein